MLVIRSAQGDPGGKVKILGGHSSIGHSKQITEYVHSNRFFSIGPRLCQPCVISYVV
jgi:hypothetical protein